MKLIHKLFHRLMNRSCKFQGCNLICTDMAKYLDVSVLSLTVGICLNYVTVKLNSSVLRGFQKYRNICLNYVTAKLNSRVLLDFQKYSNMCLNDVTTNMIAAYCKAFKKTEIYV